MAHTVTLPKRCRSFRTKKQEAEGNIISVCGVHHSAIAGFSNVVRRAASLIYLTAGPNIQSLGHIPRAHAYWS